MRVVAASKMFWSSGPSGRGDLSVPPRFGDRWFSAYVECGGKAGQFSVELLSLEFDTIELLRREESVIAFVIGDFDSDVQCSPLSSQANAATFIVDLASLTLKIYTGMVGLPPVFIDRIGAMMFISCPVPHFASFPGLSLDCIGVAQTLRWGHPLDGRSIYANCSIAPVKSVIEVGVGRTQNTARSQNAETTPIASTLGEVVASQREEFLRSARRIDRRDAFMSLSGGLDSRAALCALLETGDPVPCVTLAPNAEHLDVVLAERVAKVYGLSHELIQLGDKYFSLLPDLILKVGALTRGISVLSQSVDAFLYTSIPSYSSRISGLLGNQVGRGGVESTSAASLETSVLSPEMREVVSRCATTSWLQERFLESDYSTVLFEQEVYMWSIANYSVGAYSARQLSPYATSRMIELASNLQRMDSRFVRSSITDVRKRDLSHRLFGVKYERSFQRQIIHDFERGRRRVPLNWGWYAGGGRSIGHSILSVSNVLDAGFARLIRSGGFTTKVLRSLIGPPKQRLELVNWPLVFRRHLRDMAEDLFRSSELCGSGVVDVAQLRAMSQEHFSGEADHFATLSRIFELAVALNRQRRGHLPKVN